MADSSRNIQNRTKRQIPLFIWRTPISQPIFDKKTAEAIKAGDKKTANEAKRQKKVAVQVLEGLLTFLATYKKMYDFDFISKKHKIFVDIYLLNLNDFKMFYSFK